MTGPDPFSNIGMEMSGASLATTIEASAITVARFRSDDPTHDVIKRMDQQDAHLLILPVSEVPAHDFWSNGRHEDRSGFAPSEFTIIDLNALSACRIMGAFGYLQVHIPRPALDELAQDAGAVPVETLRIADSWKASDPTVAALTFCLSNAFSRPREVTQLFIDHVILSLQLHITHAYGGLRPAIRRMVGGLAPWQERRAKELIANDLNSRLTVQQVARECELSSAHFARAFKISVGLTPHEWLQQRRIDHAKSLLLDWDHSLTDVALRCGFSDQSHLTRTFGRAVGVTPGHWRRLQRHG